MSDNATRDDSFKAALGELLCEAEADLGQVGPEKLNALRALLALAGMFLAESERASAMRAMGSLEYALESEARAERHRSALGMKGVTW